MANSIGNVFIEGFDANVRHLAQQDQARLLARVDIRASTAENENWETLAKTDFSPKLSRGAATPVADVPWGRRKSGNTTYDQGEVVATDDITQMLADPNSNIAQSFSYGANRSQDSVIITAATGVATDGDGASVAFDTDQIVGAGYGSPISFDMVTEVTEKFLSNDISPMYRKCFVVGPAQMRKLLQTTEATNTDYANQALVNGYVNDWMGYDWIVSNLLDNGAGSGRDIFAMSNKAIGFQMNQNITSEIAKDPSRSFDWSIYSSWQGGAVRVEDAHLVWCQVSE